MSDKIEKIFSLGGELPIGKNTIAGEKKLRDLERAFSRRIGWDTDDADGEKNRILSSYTGTFAMDIGYSDED